MNVSYVLFQQLAYNKILINLYVKYFILPLCHFLKTLDLMFL